MEDNKPNPRHGTLFVISAPSGAGKTSLLARCLEEDASLSLSVSHTTRPPRVGEQDGVNYHFVDKNQFECMIQENRFLESATVFDNFYGTAESEVKNKIENGQDLILEIDWQGAQQVRKRFKHLVSIFILPPSLEVLQQRLSDRGKDEPAVIQRRLAEAQEEISHYPEFDYLVVNDDFEQAVQELKAIFSHAQILKNKDSTANQALISSLLGSES